ncbi:MAG: thioesterase domain-containing protein [Bacteroidales bacterium]|nr:thioesterase domain-containing protein [Bacteroidales bacterium]
MKLFCIPFSGGNAYSYFEFKKYLPSHMELCCLELPGRGARIQEPLLCDIDSMAEDLFHQMEGHLDGHYAIFGHSLGALLGYHLCRRMTAQGVDLPCILFVSGLSAVSLIKPDTRYLLPDDRFVSLLREMEGTPEELLADKSFLDYFLPIVKADFQSIANYEYVPAESPLKLPIAVLLGRQENVTAEDAAFWQMETEMKISIHRFEGNHFFINSQARDICRLITNLCNQSTLCS